MNTLAIEGFKCFKSKSNFDLRKITVFTGANGSGKSSVVQSLLLLRSCVERNFSTGTKGNYDCSKWKGSSVPLNGTFELRLGTDGDIFNDNDFQGKGIQITLDKSNFFIPIPPDDEKAKDFIQFKPTLIDNDLAESFLCRREFYYLHAERVGPRFNLPISFTEFSHCGFKGEYTAQVLLEKPIKVDEMRRHNDNNSEDLRIQTDAWLADICPGTIVVPQYLDALTSQIRLRNGASKSDVLATNIGFGISYSLPVIVTGLIAQKGSAMIVENPEAHLHPKGQSNLGYFLSKIAASGVRVIIETHSEHIVNGIRRGALSNFGLKTNDISMYFFNGFEKERGNDAVPIKISDMGDLTPFPIDFFDQVRQDLIQILKLSGR